jgi:hypothetical protein
VGAASHHGTAIERGGHYAAQGFAAASRCLRLPVTRSRRANPVQTPMCD